MTTTDIVGLLYCDLGGIVRGRFVPVSDLERRAGAGVGWVPANQAITPFDTLVEPNPFGSVGDLRLLPDLRTRVIVPCDDGPALDFVLCGAHLADGSPWDACPRAFLAATLALFEGDAGATVHAAFEHEFRLDGLARPQPAFSLRALRAMEPLPTRIFAALAAAGLEPELILPEFGTAQFEAPCAPAPALLAADRAVALREVVRDVALRHGSRASFSPLTTPDGAASGVHIHLSLYDDAGDNLLHDPSREWGLSELGEAFAQGVLHHAQALCALTASSAISALRLAPGRWSAGRVALGGPDREALLRIAGGSAADDRRATFNVEFRGADATASPYLALGGLLAAGAHGVEASRAGRPLGPAHRLPGSLEEALAALEADEALCAALPPRLLETFLVVKRGELAELAGLDPEERCRRYAAVY